jgi:carbon storage regulator
MLILTRRPAEIVEVGGTWDGVVTLYDRYQQPVKVQVIVLGVKGNQVRLGIECSSSVPIHRSEIADRIRKEQERPRAAANGNVAGALLHVG